MNAKITAETAIERLSIWLPFGIAGAAILFLFIMMQLSALTYPFWDHWEQAEAISIYYEKGLGDALWHVFTSLSQHTRPITVRLVFLFNAILTRWDVGSEYIYMYIVLMAGLILHFRIIRRLSGTPAISATEAMLIAVVAILYCSPANHNNHWWSWMLQLNFNALLSVLALYIMAFSGRTWPGNIAAAIICWLSVYTLTNGLFLLFTVAALAQYLSDRPFRPNKITAFWVVNVALILWSYFPIAEPGMTVRPSLISVVRFALMYIGEPVAALIHFPYYNMFEPPLDTSLSTICGTLVGGFGAYILFAYRRYFSAPPAHFLFLIGTFSFVGLSALGTGWARVGFDSFGIRNGNSSRYVITGTLFLLSIMYFMFAERHSILERLSFGAISKRYDPATKWLTRLAFVVFVAFSSFAYVNSFHIYKEAREFNRHLASGFALDGKDTTTDPHLYPSQDRLRSLRARLVYLRIGPYRGDPVK